MSEAERTLVESKSDSVKRQTQQVPSLWALFREFLVIGAVSFGGGIIAYERILLVDKRKWLSDDEFMATLAISQTTPGLISVNMALIAGDRLRGLLGAMAAAGGLILPGALFVLVAGYVYTEGADHPLANLLLVAIAAAATGMLGSVTYKIGADHFKHLKPLAIIGGTFILMSLVKLSLIWVMLIMAPIALFLYRPKS